LLEKIGSISGKSRDFIGKIHVAGFFKLLDLVLGSDFIKHGLETVVFKRLILDPLEFAAYSQNRLLP